jgi:hypothetical protein
MPLALLPADHPALVAVELHAAERAALIEVADRIGLGPSRRRQITDSGYLALVARYRCWRNQ